MVGWITREKGKGWDEIAEVKLNVETTRKVPPRFELGSLDSKSRVLTITPWGPREKRLKKYLLWQIFIFEALDAYYRNLNNVTAPPTLQQNCTFWRGNFENVWVLWLSQMA